MLLIIICILILVGSRINLGGYNPIGTAIAGAAISIGTNVYMCIVSLFMGMIPVYNMDI